MPELIAKDEVRRIALLARLSIDEKRLDALASEMSTILKHFDALTEVDVRDVEPMAHPMDRTNCLRGDVVGPMLSSHDALANAPAVEQELIAVPKVIAEGAS